MPAAAGVAGIADANHALLALAPHHCKPHAQCTPLDCKIITAVQQLSILTNRQQTAQTYSQ